MYMGRQRGSSSSYFRLIIKLIKKNFYPFFNLRTKCLTLFKGHDGIVFGGLRSFFVGNAEAACDATLAEAHIVVSRLVLP